MKSIVLLKNEQNILPLQKNIRTIAVLGPSANKVRHLFGDYSFVSHFESTAINVTGNRQYEKKMQEYLQQQLNPNDRDAYSRSIYNACSVLEAIKNKISATTEILFEPGCDILGTDKSGFQEAIQKAKQADVVIFVGGERSGLVDDCTCGESRDRIEITLPGVQSELLKDLSELGVPIVLVLLNGRPLSISWEKEHIPAILEAWLPGEEGGNAIADILFGDYNPSGKLPITFPRAVGQIPIYHYMKPTGLTTVWTWNYVEINCSPLFPFGYGLSYTRFEYSQLTTDPPQVSVMDSIRIGVVIENQGSYSG